MCPVQFLFDLIRSCVCVQTALDLFDGTVRVTPPQACNALLQRVKLTSHSLDILGNRLPHPAQSIMLARGLTGGITSTASLS